MVRAYVPGHAGVSQAEAEAWWQDQVDLAIRGEYFLSMTGFLFKATRRNT
jgi:hypothetical protein